MADRVVRVSLVATVAGYISGVQRARQETDKTRDSVAAANAKIQAQKEVIEATGRAGVVFGTIVAAGVAIAIRRYAEFDQAMSKVIATGEDARRNQEALRQAALDAGASTVFTATESANAIEELAKAGVQARDVLAGGLSASLNLAAAGGLEVADAAQIAATAMTQFSLRGEDMNHVADLLAAGAGNAQGDVNDLSEALKQSGLVAASTGLSIEETTAGLSAFAAAGLLGSDAGTSFKAMLQRLTPQSAEAQRKMDELGISAYDAQGNFIGLANFAGNLQGALRDLTPEQRNSALATIFGSDAVRAATIIYDQGAKGIQNWTKTVDQQGYAAEVARTRLDNLRGDVEQLGGAFDTTLIQSGSAANDTLRGMVQVLTELITMYGDLPAPVQGTVLAVGGVTAAIALSGGTALLAVPKWVAFREAVAASGISLRSTALTAGLAGLALGGLLAVVGVWAQEAAKAREYSDSLADSFDKVSGKATAATRAMVRDSVTAKGEGLFGSGTDSLADKADKLGVSIDTVTDAVLNNQSAIAELSVYYRAAKDDPVALAQVVDETGLSFDKARVYAQDLTQGIDEQRGAQESAHAEWERTRQVTEEASASTVTAAGAYVEATEKVSDLSSDLDKLIESINKANGVGQDAVTANAQYQDALAGIAEEVQKQRDAYEQANGTLNGFALSLDEATAAGSANAAMLADVAGSAQDAALAQFNVDKTTMSAKDATDKYAATLAAQRQAFIDSANGAGFNADLVQQLADKVFALPTERQLQILADTSQAVGAIERLVTLYNGAQITIPVRGSADYIGGGRASGGIIPGPPSKVDNRIYRVATGEFIVNAMQTARHRALLERINSGDSIQGYANGGYVQPQYASSGGNTYITENHFSSTVVAAAGQSVGSIADEVVRRVERKLK